MDDITRAEKKAKTKETVISELDKSDHALANGIMCAIDGVTSLETTVNVMREGIAVLNKSVSEMSSGMSKIYKVVAGDAEFHIDGLIQKEVSLGGRIDRVEQRNAERHEELIKKISDLENERIRALEKKVNQIWTIGATVMAIWGIFGDLIKKSVFH